MGNVALEKHYRVRELAVLWSLSAKTIRRMFAEEDGVIFKTNEVSSRRKYTTMLIPESVALRVHERLGNKPFQSSLAGGNPLRVVRLCDLDAGVSKKPRNVLKLHPGEEPADRERVS